MGKGNEGGCSVSNPIQVEMIVYKFFIHCNLQDSICMWQDHRHSMTEDYIDLHQLAQDQAETKALQDIQAILIQSGTDCGAIGLPEVESIPILSDEFNLH